MPETKIKTVVLLSDDYAHIAAIKDAVKETNPTICFIEASDSAAIFDLMNDAGCVAFTPNLIILDLDLQILVGKNLLHLLYGAFGGTSCNILLLAQESDPRCRLYSVLYGFNVLYKPACTHMYKQAITAILPAGLHTQFQ